MSFVLRFFHAPAAATVRDAVRWADGPHPDATGQNERFARFVESICEFYPNLEDEDEADRNLWPEWLQSDAHDGAVVNVLINADMLDGGVMSVIARRADAAGLQVLDEQNGLLFGPGLRYVGLGDAVPRPLPEVSNRALALMTENLRGLRFDHARQRVADAWRNVLGKGFKRSEGKSESVVWRDHGELRQLLSVRVPRSTDGRNARLYCRVGFASGSLAREWMPLLPEAYLQRRARYDAAAGGTDFEFAWYIPDPTTGELPLALSLATDSRSVFCDERGLDQLVESASGWMNEVLRPFLDRLVGTDDLLPLCINANSLEHARVGLLAFPGYPAMLALARHAGMPSRAMRRLIGATAISRGCARC